MLQKRLLAISLITILFILVFHYLALSYSWYWTFRWLDIPVHIIGGFWVSLTALWISLKIRHIDGIYGYKRKALLVMLASVLIVAIFWEIFELIIKETSLYNTGYWRDSLSDVFNSFVGGMMAFLYFIKNKKAKCPLINKNLNSNFVVVL